MSNDRFPTSCDRNQLTCKDTTSINAALIIVIARKEANMVVFSHNHKCDQRLVDWLQMKHVLWGLHPAHVGGPDRIVLH